MMEEKPKDLKPRTAENYFSLISILNGIEKKVMWSEIVYISLNIAMLFYLGVISSHPVPDAEDAMYPFHLTVFFLILVTGCSLCAYWAASSMRLQLKLRLLYFHLRYLERKMTDMDLHYFLDLNLYFDLSGDGKVTSPDGKEEITYPRIGILRMDGLFGSAKPRHFSLLMPCFFCLIYVFVFVWRFYYFLNSLLK
jgi:hypothetical protein